MTNIEKNLSLLVNNLSTTPSDKWIAADKEGNLITVSKWNLLGALIHLIKGDFAETRIQKAITQTFKSVNANFDKQGTVSVHENKNRQFKVLQKPIEADTDIGLGDDMGVTAGEVALRIAVLAPNFVPTKKEDIDEFNLAIKHDQLFINEDWITKHNKNHAKKNPL